MLPGQAPRGVAGVLPALVTLHALRRLEADLGFLLTEGLLPLDTGRAIPGEIRCMRGPVALWQAHRVRTPDTSGHALPNYCQTPPELTNVTVLMIEPCRTDFEAALAVGAGCCVKLQALPSHCGCCALQLKLPAEGVRRACRALGIPAAVT